VYWLKASSGFYDEVNFTVKNISMKLIQKLAVATAGFVMLTSVNASPVAAFSWSKITEDNFANNGTTIVAQTVSVTVSETSSQEQQKYEQTQSEFWTQSLIWFAGAVFFLAGIPTLALLFLSKDESKKSKC
jgi:hypothetical protein